MTSWNPAQYCAFLEWRTRPSHDLAQRVGLTEPRRIVDLGCGPGNSTQVCAARWCSASILGVDSSPEMIEAARRSQPASRFEVDDIGQWARRAPAPAEPIDLIFSSAALQWVEDHADIFPRLLRKLAPGGVLAVQMPAYDAIPNRVMREVAASERWRRWFPHGRANEWRSHALEFYYTVLANKANRLDLWQTDYMQPVSDVQEIVEWYKSTGLRPYLDRITDEAGREDFLHEYHAKLAPYFPTLETGGVAFLFRRIFIVATV
jgi:trans-aconitate 2-methyltransferase